MSLYLFLFQILIVTIVQFALAVVKIFDTLISVLVPATRAAANCPFGAMRLIIFFKLDVTQRA